MRETGPHEIESGLEYRDNGVYVHAKSIFKKVNQGVNNIQLQTPGKGWPGKAGWRGLREGLSRGLRVQVSKFLLRFFFEYFEEFLGSKRNCKNQSTWKK